MSHKLARPAHASPAHTAAVASNRRLALWTAALIAFAVAVGAGIVLAAPSDGDPIEATQVNDMGMPVVETPGWAHGTTTAGDIQVVGATWDLGHVPLNVAVRPTWELRNTGTEPVTLGDPQPEVREGCCPGPLTLGTHTLAPGETTILTFELSMHPGMDGPHDLAVHLPVTSPEGTDQLTVDVNGDFR